MKRVGFVTREHLEEYKARGGLARGAAAVGDPHVCRGAGDTSFVELEVFHLD